MQFRFQSPGDIAFNILGLPVYWYGIILACAVFIGFLTAYWLYKKFYGKDASKILDISPYIVIIGIIGARLYYCLVNFSYYQNHLGEIFFIRQGGLSIHGMIIVGILALFGFAKYYKISFLKLTDVYLCASALAQSIGRWGNFFNSEAFGYPTNLPWKLFIPLSKRPLEMFNFDYFHPTFLYESILDFCLFVVLYLLFKRCSKYPGVITCLYLILYSVIRIFVEYFRIDSVLNIYGFPVAQIMSVAMILAGSIGLVVLYRRRIDF